MTLVFYLFIPKYTYAHIKIILPIYFNTRFTLVKEKCYAINKVFVITGTIRVKKEKRNSKEVM